MAIRLPSISWSSVDPFVQGLKMGGIMNQSLEQDDTYRQGRHHFITALNQILEFSLALEQTARYLQAAHINYSLTGWHIVNVAVPVAVAHLASRQIHFLHLTEGANFIQNHWSQMSLVALAVASLGLLVLGQTVLATTTLVYLTIGELNRYNILPESVQKVVHYANFFIGNFTGIYLGSNFVRLVCILNVATRVINQAIQIYFINYKPLIIAEKAISKEEKQGEKISLHDLTLLSYSTPCAINMEHIQKKPLPSVDEAVQIDAILDVYDCIDWPKHVHVIEKKLAKDRRWLEVGQFEAEPLAYFERNLRQLVTSIKHHEILEGKPASYEMLEFYCRFIAQELKKQDEMTQADLLIWLGVEGGNYCGTGKFGIVEEVYEDLLSQATSLPLETRILACEQQERQRIWQNIYQHIWRSNPLIQLFGYMSDVNAIHNANLFINLVQAGQRFGIPHQAAQNDQSATINPLIHYLAFMFVDQIEKCFWKGGIMLQWYLASDENSLAMGGWHRMHFKWEEVNVTPYHERAILRRLSETIGTPQIPLSDIYAWWQQWIDRQEDLTEEEKEKLSEELQAIPGKDQNGEDLPLTLNGDPFEVNGKIQPKFLKAMLIDMNILEKPIL